MEDECSQWERLAGEFVEAGQFYQAANQYKQAADCYLERVLAMARKSAEYYHMHAESSLEKGNHRAASTSYFEAATQYRQTDDLSTALTLYENAARESLLEQMTETAAQSYLWAAYACHKLGNAEYFLTCAKNVGDLYEQAAKKALDEGKAERAVIDFSLAAMGFATIDRTKDAKELIKTAKRIIDKTRWDWLGILLSFSEALTNNKLDEAADLLRKFKEEDTIKDVMSACLDILDEREMQKK
jgi:tetratricopeptide (TPR) repeat protein